MAVVEILLLAGLGAWFAASTLVALGVGSAQPWMRWAGRFRAVVVWNVFGANRQGAGRAATFCIQIRDARGASDSGWKTAAEGHAGWVWHAWLWQPQRRLADGLRCYAKAIGASSGEPASAVAASRRRLAEEAVRDYLARACPMAPGHTREIRLVIRYSRALSVGSEAGSLLLPTAGAAALAAPYGSERRESERVVVFSRRADDAA